MALLSYRKLAPWHRRTAIVAGVGLAVWIGSALVMLLPWGANPWAPPETIPLADVALSPADLAHRLGPPAPVEVVLRAVDGVPVYKVERDGEVARYDARTGEPFALSDAQAERLAARLAKPEGAAVETLAFESHTEGYTWGELPVLRVAFADDPSEWWFVDPDGEVRHSTRTARVRKAIDELHRFGQLRALVGDPGRKAALLGFSLLGVAVLATGYAMVWARRPRRPSGAAARRRE